MPRLKMRGVRRYGGAQGVGTVASVLTGTQSTHKHTKKTDRKCLVWRACVLVCVLMHVLVSNSTHRIAAARILTGYLYFLLL